MSILSLNDVITNFYAYVSPVVLHIVGRAFVVVLCVWNAAERYRKSFLARRFLYIVLFWFFCVLVWGPQGLVSCSKYNYSVVRDRFQWCVLSQRRDVSRVEELGVMCNSTSIGSLERSTWRAWRRVMMWSCCCWTRELFLDQTCRHSMVRVDRSIGDHSINQ